MTKLQTEGAGMTYSFEEASGIISKPLPGKSKAKTIGSLTET